MKYLAFLVCANLAFSSLSAQIVEQSLQEPFISLAKPNATIDQNDTINESMVDLLECHVVDSIVHMRKQRHRFLGFATELLKWSGYYWYSINFRKEKFVGTVMRTSVYSKKAFKEHDVNFDVVPHLPQYLELAYNARMKQTVTGRGKKITRGKTGVAPYIHPSLAKHAEAYRIHCECTPPDKVHRKLLDSLFYPTSELTEHQDHPNMNNHKPSIGVYGTYILDCNHTCHPEIHPYEWIWWLDTKHQSEYQKRWFVGLMRDHSERLRGWQKGPRVGTVKIPFVVNVNQDTASIVLTNLVSNGFKDKYQALLEPSMTILDQNDLHLQTFSTSSKSITVRLQVENAESQKQNVGFAYEDLSYDPELNLLSGYLKVQAAVYNVYTFSLRYSSR